MGIERFEDLKSWQEARRLMQMVYRMTETKPFHEDRKLCWQIQDASVSSMGNIAEGHGRFSFEDKRRFLDIALGSCKEIQSHLYVALDQHYIQQQDFDHVYRQADIVGQLVGGSIRNLDQQITSRPPRSSSTRQRPR